MLVRYATLQFRRSSKRKYSQDGLDEICVLERLTMSECQDAPEPSERIEKRRSPESVCADLLHPRVRRPIARGTRI